MEIPISYLADYKTVLFVLIPLTYLGVIVTILMENRNPAKSIGYIMVLVFLPGIGLIIYYFFGRDLRKQKIFKKKAFKDMQIAEEYLLKYKEHSEEVLGKMEAEIGNLSQPFRQLFLQNQSHIHGRNQVTLLNNGEEKFPALFQDLKQAQHHIHIEYYIFSKDDVGNRLIEILLKKLSEGVEVRIIIDGQGSRRIKDLPKILKEKGAEVYTFMPVRFSSLAQANYRNHRKIVVIDGKVGFIGGINMDDRYWNTGKHDLYWRDVHLKIVGSAVKELQFHFFESLSFVAQKQYDLDMKYFPSQANNPEGATVSIIASGPASAFPYNMEALVSAILQAKRSVKIVNPYFIPSDQLMSALGMAAASGVIVELIIPKTPDNFIVGHSSFSYLKPLLKRGVHIYLYEKGFIHSKTMTVDDEIAFIGTVNMDIRSFYINFEIAAIVKDSDLCHLMSDSFEEDKRNSIKINKEQWAQRSLWNRFLDSICRLLTPLL